MNKKFSVFQVVEFLYLAVTLYKAESELEIHQWIQI